MTAPRNPNAVFWEFLNSFGPDQGHGSGVDHNPGPSPDFFGPGQRSGAAGPWKHWEEWLGTPEPGQRRGADGPWKHWEQWLGAPEPGAAWPRHRGQQEDREHPMSENQAREAAAEHGGTEKDDSPDTMGVPDPAEVTPEESDADLPSYEQFTGRGHGHGRDRGRGRGRGRGHCHRGGPDHRGPGGHRFGPHHPHHPHHPHPHPHPGPPPFGAPHFGFHPPPPPPPPHAPPPHAPPHWHGPGHHGPHGPQPPHGRPPFDFGGLMRGIAQHLGNYAACGPGNPTARGPSDTSESFAPPVDVFNTDRAYVLHVALPGAKKEDVGVSWDPDTGVLRIAGVVHRPGDEAFLQTLTTAERRVGEFERTVPLPPPEAATKDEVDGFGITAKMEDGVLVVTVPKAEKEWMEVHKIDIE